jgi:hypothetical protein
MIGGRLMHRDDNHLSYDGDLRVGQAFWRHRNGKAQPQK